MSMNVEIRPVEAHEVEDVAALARIVWQHAYPGIISQAQIDFMLAQRYGAEHMRTELATPGVWWDQAFVAGERVGFASSLLTGEPGEIKLDKLYVHPERQRSGIGGALIRRVVEHGRASDCTRLILAVNKNNVRAIASYEKNGFAIVDSVRVDIGNGFVMDDFIMARSIA